MARSNVVRVSLLGDAGDLNKELGKTERAFEGVEDAGRNAGKGMDRASEGFDAVDTKAMGFRDMMTGVQDTMMGTAEIAKGNLFEGFVTLGAGIGDLASGMVNFIIPTIKNLSKQMLANAKAAVITAGKHVAAIGKKIAAWAMLGVKSMIHAAKVAAAWLVAIGPIAIVIAAVIGLVVLIVKNWDKIKEVIQAGWKFVKEKSKELWDWLKDAVSGVGRWIKDAFKSAVNFVKDLFLNFTPMGLIIKHFDKIKELATGVKDWIVDKFNAVVDFFKRLPNRISTAASGMWDGIKNAFKGAVNWIIGKWNNLSLRVGGQTISLPFGNSFTIPSITLRTPNIPYLHSGGVFQAPHGQSEGLAMLRSGERVLPSVASRKSEAPNMVFNISTLDPQAAGRAVVQALQTYERSNGAIPVSVRA